MGWLAAEFVVVVLGVAVGLAVDAWREGRHDVAVEISYLGRLKANLEADTAEFLQGSRLDSLRGEAVVSFLDALDQGPPSGDPLASLDGLAASLTVSFSTPVRDTYDELLNQGDLGRVRSSTVREALTAYYGVATNSQAAQFPEWKESASRVEFLLMERLSPAIYRWVQSASNPRRVVGRPTDVPEPTPTEVRSLLRQVNMDGEMQNLLFRMSRVQLRVAGWHGFQARAAADLLTLLDEEIARLR